jgi:hypothetical protein
MYDLSDIKRGLEDPRQIVLEMCRLYYQRLRTRSYNPNGVDIFAEEWDNLLLLDACRYDMFTEYNTLPGRLESRESRGSSTPEFLKGNVAGRDLTDVVYVTANPQYHRNRDLFDATFHYIDNVWSSSGWDDEFRTVRPEVVTEAARRAAERFPHKRLLVHYMQPHYPFIGETGRELVPGQNLNIWNEIAEQNISIDDSRLWDAFHENLEIALPAVRELMDSIDGRTVVSSDHGQLMRERLFPIPLRHYGHPLGIHMEELVKVPWLVDDGSRRTTTADPPVVEDDESVDTSTVTERLESLGYV